MATRKPRSSDAAPNTYEVLMPLNHDQYDYAVGDQVELSAEAAAPLLERGVVKALAPEQA